MVGITLYIFDDLKFILMSSIFFAKLQSIIVLVGKISHNILKGSLAWQIFFALVVTGDTLIWYLVVPPTFSDVRLWSI